MPWVGQPCSVITAVNQANQSESVTVPARSGVVKQTLVKTIWQVSAGSQSCYASFTATAAPGSAVVR